MRTQVPRLTVRRLIMSQADAPINGGANHKPWRRESQTFAHCGLHVPGIQTYQLPDRRHPQATRSPVTARPPSATTDFLATLVRAYGPELLSLRPGRDDAESDCTVQGHCEFPHPRPDCFQHRPTRVDSSPFTALVTSNGAYIEYSFVVPGGWCLRVVELD